MDITKFCTSCNQCRELKNEIINLSKLVEQGADLTVGQDSAVYIEGFSLLQHCRIVH